MWAIIGTVFKLLMEWFKIKIEKDKNKKKMKVDAFKEVNYGIQKGDTSRITSGLDRLNRLDRL